MKSIGARLARAVNRVFARSGSVLDGRFHHRVLRTPREVRNALAYVLLNARRHWAKLRRGRRPPVRLDEASSARWFDGWRQAWRARLATDDEVGEAERPEIAPGRTWLLRIGWRRHGLIDPREVPGVKRRAGGWTRERMLSADSMLMFGQISAATSFWRPTRRGEPGAVVARSRLQDGSRA